MVLADGATDFVDGAESGPNSSPFADKELGTVDPGPESLMPLFGQHSALTGATVLLSHA